MWLNGPTPVAAFMYPLMSLGIKNLWNGHIFLEWSPFNIFNIMSNIWLHLVLIDEFIVGHHHPNL